MARRVRKINLSTGIILIMLLVFVVIIGVPVNAYAAETGTESETNVFTDYNEDYYDSYDQAVEECPVLSVQENNIFAPQVSSSVAADTVICNSVEDAGDYLRNRMVNRQATATFILNNPEGYTGREGFALIKAEVFKETGKPNEGDYLYWNYAGIDGDADNVDDGILYTLNTIRYLSTTAEEKKIDTEVSRLMNNEFKGWKNMSDFEIAKKVYAWITDNYSYVSGSDRHSTYSGLIEHETVCQGFSTSAYRLLMEMGVSCRLIANDSHGWNIVNIGNEYYNIDATWDVGLRESEWKYFLRANKTFENGPMHDRGSRFNTAEFNLKYPMAKSDYNWIPNNDSISIKYRTHVQTHDWKSWVSDGKMSGTEGESKRLEGIQIKLDNREDYNIGVEYMSHIQSYGWESDWKPEGNVSGSVGKSKRLEAIKVRLVGEDSRLFDIYYRVHVQTYGWLGWAKNGESAGTAGLAKRLEGIEIIVLPKGEVPNVIVGFAFIESGKTSYENNDKTGKVNYLTHVQSDGWQQYVSDGSISGTVGESKRLEGIRINLANLNCSGGIRYRTHIQTFGWESGWRQDGVLSGTYGMAKRLEAIQIELYGEAKQHYDVYYRVHAQSYGWLGWTKNGYPAGTEGLSKRLEAIQIILLPKGSAAPGSMEASFIKR